MATSRLKLISGNAYLYTGTEGLYQVILGQAQELTNLDKVVAHGSLQVSGSVYLMNQISAPAPGGNEAVLYARAGTLYFKNSGGSETPVGGGGGGISDGDKGDITVSASGATWTIDGLAVSTAKIAAAAVTYAKIQNISASDKILGRSTAGAGSVEEITCTSAGRALIDDADASAQRTTLGLGSLAVKSTVATADIDSDTVTYAKIQNVSAADKLLGRVSQGAGDIEEVTCTSAGRALLDDADASAQRTTLGLGTLSTASSIATANIDNDGVTNVKLANMADSTIKGRASGAGTGDPTDLTATQATAILNEFTIALKGLAPASGGGTTNFLRADGTWAAPSSVSAAGDSAQVQFNNGGSFAADAGLTYNSNDDLLSIGAAGVSTSGIATAASTFSIANSTATKINFAAAGTDISVGSSTGTTFVKHNLNVSGGLLYDGEIYTNSLKTYNVSILASSTMNLRYIRFTQGVNPLSCQIPAASTTKGRVLTIINDSSDARVDVVSIAGNIVGNGNTNGTTYRLALRANGEGSRWIEIVSNGDNWYIVNGGILPTQPQVNV